MMPQEQNCPASDRSYIETVYAVTHPHHTGGRICSSRRKARPLFEKACDMLTRPIEAGASCSREATLSDITGYPRVPRGSNDL